MTRGIPHAQINPSLVDVNLCRCSATSGDPGELRAIEVNAVNGNDEAAAMDVRVMLDGVVQKTTTLTIPANTGNNLVTIQYHLPDTPGDYDVRAETANVRPA